MAIAGILNEQQTALAQSRAQNIAGAAEVGAIRNNQFVFFAAFDGTRNDKDDVKRSGNPQDTNVAELFKQTKSVEKAHPKGNLRAGYYPGHGTEGSLVASAWFPGQVTQESINTAQRAYREFAEQASKWLKQHPNGEVTTAITAFSRGGATAAVFTHLLYRDGLIDQDTKKVLIPPGDVGVSAGVIFDPVTTGVDANVAFAPNVKNIAVLQAQNEYRNFFKGVDYAGQPGVKILEATGNHCNIGGGYGDDSLGNLHLKAATLFLQKSGLPIAEVDASRRFNPNLAMKVYEESDKPKDVNYAARMMGHEERGKWDVYATFAEGQLTQPARLLDKVAQPATTQYMSDKVIEKFTLYNHENLIKARSYREDPLEIALNKHPDLAGALAAKVFMQKEIANMPQQSQEIVTRQFDDNMVRNIEKGNLPVLPTKNQQSYEQQAVVEY